MPHNYEFWHRALRGEKQPVHEGEVHPGRWYMRQKEGPRLPVAIWEDGEDNLVALVGFDGRARFRDPLEIWTYVCQHPVSDEAYRQAFETGRWPDDPPEPVAPNIERDDDTPEDKHSVAKNTLAGEMETGERYLAEKVESQEQADLVSVLATRVGKLAKRADDVRKVEKQPHLDAARAVDDKWRDVIADAKALRERLLAHVQPWLDRLQAEEQERQRVEREKADELRRKAAEANDPDSAKELTQQAAEADREASEHRNPQAGRTGSKVAMRTETKAIITDYDKLIEAIKGTDEVREIAQTLANRAARAGVPLPGTEIEKRKKAA